MKTNDQTDKEPDTTSAKTKAAKRWTKTKVENLVRHQSGVYYARLAIGGKETWRSLKTPLLEVAKAKLMTLKKEVAESAPAKAKKGERMTMGQAMQVRLAQIDSDSELKPGSKSHYRQCMAMLRKSWPDLDSMLAVKLTEAHCQEWRSKLQGTVSAQRLNHVIAMLEQSVDIAIKDGQRYGNPARALDRASIPKKNITLPSKAQFEEWIQAMRQRRGRFSRHSADFVELLAYSGMRLTEAKNLRWRDVDFERGVIRIHGDPITGTKSGESRTVPMNPALRDLLQRLHTKSAHLDDTVSTVGEAQKCMELAAEGIGMVRITHHDLRHYYATICIEAGVDIPTVSRWLGHSDGGVLAMKTYGHLRDEHSKAAALTVSFSSAPAAENVLPFVHPAQATA
jgi:integrase